MSIFKPAILTLLSLLILVPPTWGMNDDDTESGSSVVSQSLDHSQRQAEIMFPEREEPYSYSEIKAVFGNVLCQNAQEFFKKCFNIMLDPTFSKPKHSNAVIIKGYQCLYAKMLEVKALGTEEEREKAQLEALHQLFAFHKGEIGRFDPDLAQQINGFPCHSCSRTAATELGITDQKY